MSGLVVVDLQKCSKGLQSIKTSKARKVWTFRSLILSSADDLFTYKIVNFFKKIASLFKKFSKLRNFGNF